MILVSVWFNLYTHILHCTRAALHTPGARAAQTQTWQILVERGGVRSRWYHLRSPEISWCKMSFVYFSRLAMSARGDAMTSCSGNVERTPCLSTKLCATAVGGWDGVRAVTCEGAGFTGS